MVVGRVLKIKYEMRGSHQRLSFFDVKKPACQKTVAKKGKKLCMN